MQNEQETEENPYRSPRADLWLSHKPGRRRSLQLFLLISSLPPVLLLGVGTGAGIIGVLPPQPLVAVLLLAMLLNGPALMIVGVYQLSTRRGSVAEGWLCVLLSLTYFFLVAIVTMA